MKPNIRKKLTGLGAILFICMMVALLSFFRALRYQTDSVHIEAESKKSITVNHELQKPKVNLNYPVIDVSGWQTPSDIDYNTLSQNIVGAVVRVQATIGKEDTSSNKDGKDSAFHEHIKSFQERDVPVAVYAFVSGKTKDEMKKQAKSFYTLASPYKPTYYWLDVEVTHMSDMNGGIEAFRSELESLGVKNIGIYCQDWFIKANNIDVSKFNAIWMAAYGRNIGVWDTSPVTDLKYDMHQYTDQGKLSGYSGNLDLNMIRTQDEYNKLFRSGTK